MPPVDEQAGTLAEHLARATAFLSETTMALRDWYAGDVEVEVGQRDRRPPTRVSRRHSVPYVRSRDAEKSACNWRQDGKPSRPLCGAPDETNREREPPLVSEHERSPSEDESQVRFAPHQSWEYPMSRAEKVMRLHRANDELQRLLAWEVRAAQKELRRMKSRCSQGSQASTSCRSSDAAFPESLDEDDDQVGQEEGLDPYPHDDEPVISSGDETVAHEERRRRDSTSSMTTTTTSDSASDHLAAFWSFIDAAAGFVESFGVASLWPWSSEQADSEPLASSAPAHWSEGESDYDRYSSSARRRRLRVCDEGRPLHGRKSLLGQLLDESSESSDSDRSLDMSSSYPLSSRGRTSSEEDRPEEGYSF